MNWKYLAIGIGVVVVVGGAGAAYWFSNTQPIPLATPATPVTKLPETYGECLSSVKFSELRDHELKCVFSVTLRDEEVYRECEDIGGMLSHGDPATKPEQYVCRLEYYNPDYAFPTTHGECIKESKGVDMSISTDLRTCLISITLGPAYNKEVAMQLIEDCKNRNPIASSQEFCTIRMEP